MLLAARLLPSRISMLSLLAFTLGVGLLVFSGLSPDVNCGAGSWNCATFLGVAVVSTSIGVGVGLCLTALLVFLSSIVRLIWASVPALEPRGKSVPVGLAMALAHIGVFGALSLAGALPLGWMWWLGAFGMVGVGFTDTGVYLVQ